MRNWPAWLPNLNSWINAILLAAIVAIGTALGSQLLSLFWFILQFILSVINILPNFIRTIIISIIGYIFLFASYISPILVLSPIVIVAFANHYINLALDRYFPDIRLSEMPKAEGFFPGIISWWEGFYGLLVIILAFLGSDIILAVVPFLPFNNEIQEFESANSGRLLIWFYLIVLLFFQPIYVPIARLFIWLVIAAYLYHLESRFRQYFMSLNSGSGNGD